MWKVAEQFLLIVIALFIISNMIIPLFFAGLKPFWIFKSKWAQEVFTDEKQSGSIVGRMKIVKPKIDELKEEVTDIQQEAADELDKAARIKKQTDKLI